jgi:prepilin-type N-terminal cleavage/methylation domain-containing protein
MLELAHSKRLWGGVERKPFLSKAFTLSEILITIGIVGIVAGMTIPTITHKIRNKVLEIQFKNTYAKLSQAIKQMQVNTDISGIGSYCTYHNGTFNGYTNVNECFSELKKAYPINTKGIKRDNLSIYGTTDVKVRKLDNMAVLFTQYGKKDGSYLGYLINSGTFYLSIDTNGASKPNRLGYDIFMFYVSKTDDKIEGFKPSSVTDEELEKYGNKIANSNNTDGDKAYSYSIYGYPCNYSSTQTSNGIGCGYYAIRNKCPDGSNKGYFECLK